MNTIHLIHNKPMGFSCLETEAFFLKMKIVKNLKIKTPIPLFSLNTLMLRFL